MVGLIDMAPSTDTVEVQGTSVAVHGVSVRWFTPATVHATAAFEFRSRGGALNISR
jgi:hypothetical protein